MAASQYEPTIVEAVGVFDDIRHLNHAVTELESASFARQDISILDRKAALRRGFGVNSIDPEIVEDDPDAPRAAPARTEEKAIGVGVILGAGFYLGTLGGVIAALPTTSILALAAAGGSGALIGGALAGLIVAALKLNYEDAVHRQAVEGNLILWVHAADRAQEQTACAIMKKHGGRHVHIHNIPTTH